MDKKEKEIPVMSEKRRKRIERLKRMICSIWFVRRNFFAGVGICGVCISLVVITSIYYGQYRDEQNLIKQQEQLRQEREQTEQIDHGTDLWYPSAGVAKILDDMICDGFEQAKNQKPASILPEYQRLHEQNPDLIGWLSIDDTVIDYPVMQTPEDENYYLYLDFNKQENKNGSLIMDTDVTVGTGTLSTSYANGTSPSTNLIIHGHTMKSGQMFGNLKLYAEEAYGKEHSSICFDSLYEHREYELLAVFYSQVYYEKDEVFKYYQFFQADTQAEFDDWYENIKKLSLYDTGVTSKLGDEFITLSCCSYQVENGRFVVVGRRIE